jgi:release factor glutamine methyltransferase
MTDWTTPERLRAAAARLGAAGIDEPMREARLLAREAKDASAFDAFIARREKREPVAYILGRKEFWSLEIEVTPAVLIPRPDSETLIETALKEYKAPPARILDLGTGSGCLLIALLTEWPTARGVGVDISPDAIAVAKRNAERLGVAARASFAVADFANLTLGERFDLVVANPPYIADTEYAHLDPDVRDHEPRLALTSGYDGLRDIERIARALQNVMTDEGLALIEIGHDQGESAAQTLRNEGLIVRRVVKDLGARDRVIVATLPQGRSPQRKTQKNPLDSAWKSV